MTPPGGIRLRELWKGGVNCPSHVIPEERVTRAFRGTAGLVIVQVPLEWTALMEFGYPCGHPSSNQGASRAHCRNELDAGP